MMKTQGSSEEKFRLIVEAVPNAIVLVDFDSFFKIINSIEKFWFNVVSLPPK